MEPLPSLEAFTKTAQSYDAIPLISRVLSDYDTPLSIFKKLNADYLLESVAKGESVGRYSIIGLGEQIKITLSGQTVNLSEFYPTQTHHPVHQETIRTYKNPLHFIRDYFLSLKTPPTPLELPFLGGLLGYLGYETVSYFEAVPVGKDVLNVPDGWMVFPEIVAIYDNVSRELTVCTVVLTRRRCNNQPWDPTYGDRNFERLPKALLSDVYHEARKRLMNVMAKIIQPPQNPLSFYQPALKLEKLPEYFKLPAADFTSNMDYDTYASGVENLIENIREGEIIQAVFSKRYSLPVKSSGLELYRSLKMLNPSPFLYYLNCKEFELAGSSPEVMVRLRGEDLLLRPIAGSIRRGKDHLEDDKLAQELLENKKEQAEHLMLVDLGRNDLARVARAGTVNVENYMTVEKYSQIQHIVSTVTAQKKPNLDAIDVIAATFPAGTLSGAPKVRAMELIADLEQEKRGPYGGMVFNLSLNGNLDSCIYIRSFLIFESMLHLQVGSGIVLDSTPEYEHKECLQKARALMNAYDLTRKRFMQFLETK